MDPDDEATELLATLDTIEASPLVITIDIAELVGYCWDADKILDFIRRARDIVG